MCRNRHISSDKIHTASKKGNKGRKSGGIKIFAKPHIKPFIKVTKATEYYCWLEIDKNLFYNLDRNPLICAIYSQPIASKYYSEEAWEELETDLIYMTNTAVPFCIIGDMNGRVGEETEMCESYKHSDSDSQDNNNTRIVARTKRKNCDKANPCIIG